MPLACLAQLDRSHRRHDDVMAQLLEAARRLAAGRPHDTDLDAVREAVAYFERAVPRHFLDEEGSVFPRLSTRRPDLAEALAALSAEHPAQIALQNLVAECAKGLGGEPRPGAGKALLEVAEKLAEQHRAHVAKEDAIFKGAEGALTAQDDTDIVAEMETRRDRETDDGGMRRHGGGGSGGGGSGGGGGGGRRARSETLANKPGGRSSAPHRPAAAATAKDGTPRPATAIAKSSAPAAKTAKAPQRPQATKPAAARKPNKPAKRR